MSTRVPIWNALMHENLVSRLYKMRQRVGSFRRHDTSMYLDRVYRLQVEFSEISELLARSPKLEQRDQLTHRRMEIVAEASELVFALEATARIRRVPGCDPVSRSLLAVSSD
jgi:hypothetical protein